MSLLFSITYGLYLLSAKDVNKQNACMVNTVLQQTSTPEQISVTVNKNNYTCQMIAKVGKFAVNILSTKTTFDFIKNFGMQSGKNIDKFDGIKTIFSNGGIATNVENSLGFIEVAVENTLDLGTHIMFVGKIVQSQPLEKGEPLTYAYYHANTKPKPTASVTNEETWVCTVCNHIHKGAITADFICPICKHGIGDFEKQ